MEQWSTYIQLLDEFSFDSGTPVAGDVVRGDVDADGEEGDADADPQDHHHHHQSVVSAPGICAADYDVKYRARIKRLR